MYLTCVISKCPEKYRHLLRDERRQELKKQLFNKQYIIEKKSAYIIFTKSMYNTNVFTTASSFLV